MSPAQLAAIHASAMTIPGPWSAKDFQELIVTEGTFLVSKEDVGFALGRIVLDEAELLTLAVKPDAQRQGIGRACLSSFEKTAAEQGALRCHLEVAECNKAARALYRAMGWQEAGRRRAYYKSETARIDAIMMTKQPCAD